jgi:hypothetical protein
MMMGVLRLWESRSLVVGGERKAELGYLTAGAGKYWRVHGI